MAKDTSLFIVFHPGGEPAGVVPFEQEGSLPFLFSSQLLLRYRLEDGVVVDRFEGLTDDEALTKVEEETRARAAEDARRAAEAAAKRPYTIFKTTVIQRMTDAELVKFRAGYNQQDERGQMMWDDCTSLVSTDTYFGMLRQLFDATYGADRSKELLAPIV